MTAPAEQAPGELYRPCRQCSRCCSGTEREPQPGDCYDAWLDRSVRAYLGRPQ